MKILAIDTSCDETSAAVTEGRRILSNVLFSQIDIHKEWGGVVPNLAKRAHEERIDAIIEQALTKADVTMDNIDAIAVTQGPGLAIALGVGISKAKELAKKHDKKLIAVNHMVGHIYSCFAQDPDGEPDVEFEFPYIAVLASGKHSELVLFTNHMTFEKVGVTLDDAIGESLDKAARMLIGPKAYPGGPLIEKLAKEGNTTWFELPVPMRKSSTLNFSYSGLKTALLYKVQDLTDEQLEEHRADLAASYQQAAFGSLILQLKRTMKKYNVKNIAVGGGVIANAFLRKSVQDIVEKEGGSVLYPQLPGLFGDNAAMIGIAADYQAEAGDFVEDINGLEREARKSL